MAENNNRVPYGNCAIVDKIGNARVIISTDCIIGKTDEDFRKTYKEIQELYLRAEQQRAIRESGGKNSA